MGPGKYMTTLKVLLTSCYRHSIGDTPRLRRIREYVHNISDWIVWHYLYNFMLGTLFPSERFLSHKGFTAERVFNEVNMCTKSYILVLEDEKARRGVMSWT